MGFCLDKKPTQQRRNFTNLIVASAGTSTAITTQNSGKASGRFYFNFTGFPFPLGPFLNRRTIRKEIMLLSSLGLKSKSRGGPFSK
ncbi:hypothetical protein K1719_028388 [Acacia pycnantha]|nr:hypothetical protein K1719_045760 [Acacia pycnantha]KAI9090903.1 hypothetical protein K1719_028388 [Acacia pycnantha]